MYTQKQKQNKGFTLIETVIYIALFSIILSGILLSVYAILESSNHNQTAAMVTEEGNFIARKIALAITTKNTALLADPSSLSENTVMENYALVHTVASSDGISPENTAIRFTLTARTKSGLPYSQNFSTIFYAHK